MTACQRGNSKAPHRTGEHLFDIGRRPKTQHRTPPSRDGPPSNAAVHPLPPPTHHNHPCRRDRPHDLEQPVTVRAATDATTASLKMEDFGLLKGTPLILAGSGRRRA